MFITNNHPSFQLWWKENLFKHQKVSKYYDHDCSLFSHSFIYLSNNLWDGYINDKLKISMDFKNKQRKCMKQYFLKWKSILFWNCIQYNIHWDKIQMLKKFPSDKIKSTKNALCFLLQAPTHQSFFLFCDSYMSYRTRFVSLKLCVVFSIFDSVWFLFWFLSLCFFSAKCMDSLTSKRHNSFQN